MPALPSGHRGRQSRSAEPAATHGLGGVCSVTARLSQAARPQGDRSHAVAQRSAGGRGPPDAGGPMCLPASLSLPPARAQVRVWSPRPVDGPFPGLHHPSLLPCSSSAGGHVPGTCGVSRFPVCWVPGGCPAPRCPGGGASTSRGLALP